MKGLITTVSGKSGASFLVPVSWMSMGVTLAKRLGDAL